MYDTAEEAQNRLGDTVCLYDAKPVYVHSVRMRGVTFEIIAYTMPYKGLDDSLVFRLDDPKFQYRAIPLGYANIGPTATYFARKPLRRYKQGLSRENLVTLDGRKFGNAVGVRARDGGDDMNWMNVLGSPDFTKMFLNEYPSIKQAATKVLRDIENKTSVAFDRNFAVKNGFGGVLDLWHKGQKIAWSEDAQRFRLAEQFGYFRETLERQGLETREGQNLL